MKSVVFVAIVAISQVALGQASNWKEDEIKRLVEMMQYHEATLPTHKEDLEAMKIGRVNKSIKDSFVVTESNGKKRYQFKSSKIKEHFVAKKEKFLNDPDLFGKETIKDLKQGSTVYIRSEDGSPYVFEIIQIIDNDNCLVKCLANDQLLWLKCGNSQLKDGDKTQISELVHVVGRKQYATAIGATKTILEIELVDKDVLKNRAKEIFEEKKKKASK